MLRLLIDVLGVDSKQSRHSPMYGGTPLFQTPEMRTPLYSRTSQTKAEPEIRPGHFLVGPKVSGIEEFHCYTINFADAWRT